MDVSPIFFLEFGLFGGVAIGWGLWQLWWLRRDRRQREAEEQENKNVKEKSEHSSGHPEGQ